MIALERLLPMFGIYPNKIIYKNPEYATAPKVQHIYLPVPSEPVYHPKPVQSEPVYHHKPILSEPLHHHHHYQLQSKPHYLDYHYSPQRTHLHTSITGSSDIGLKHVTPYNSNPPSVYHAPVKSGSPSLTSPVHIKEESVPKLPSPHPSESYIPIQHHNHHQPYVHQHITPTPIIKYLTPDHFIPIHPTIPTIPTGHPSVHVEHKPHLHFYGAHEHSSEHSFENHLEHGQGGPHLAADESDEGEHEHYHISSPHQPLHHYEQQHADSLVHQIQAKQYTLPHHILQQKQPFLYQSHYKVLPLSKPLTFTKPDLKFRSEVGATKPFVVKPYPNNLYYPLLPPSYIRTDPNIKPVVEQAVEESLRRHQTMNPTQSQGTNNTAAHANNNNDDDQFKPMIMPTNATKVPHEKTTEPNAGTAYTMMSNKCEEKCNAESKTKDENSEAVCGTNGKVYGTKTQFICAQKCGMKGKDFHPFPF